MLKMKRRMNMRYTKTCLCICLLLAVCVLTAAAEVNATPLTLSTPATAVIANGGDYAYFSFTPEETRGYCFTSTGSNDTYGYLYDANMNQLAFDDDSGENTNFRIVRELQAGTLYYFGARFYSSSRTGEFPVMLSLDNRLSASLAYDSVRTVIPGGTVYLHVNASCDQGGLHYQWYRSDNTAIEDATGAEYSAVIQSNGSFYCIVTDDFNNTVRVNASVYADNRVRASAVEEDIYVALGGSAQLQVRASCAVGSLAYRWYRSNGDDDATLIEGETAATLTVADVRSYAEYHCIVGDEYGESISVNFSVGVENHLTVSRVGNYDVYASPDDEGVTLSVRASCDTGGLHYQWTDDNDSVCGDEASLYVENGDGFWGGYRCRVSDDFGNAEPVAFYLHTTNSLTVSQGDSHISAPYGQTAALRVGAYCDAGALSYAWTAWTWNAGESEWVRVNDFEAPNASVCTTLPVTEMTRYICTVSDGYENEEDVYFYVSVENGLTVQPLGDTYIERASGQAVTLRVQASCNSGELQYRWYGDYYDSSRHEWITGTIAGANGSELTLTDVMREGSFTCTVTDQYGGEEEVEFFVDRVYNFTAEADGPSLVRLDAGQSATLRVRTSGAAGNVSYSWYLGDDDENPLGNEAVFTTPALAQNREYYCEVSDSEGVTVNVRFFCMVNQSSILSLALNTDTAVSITDGGMRLYSFRPTVTSLYTLESWGPDDSYAHLYDANMNELARDDDGGSRENFHLVETLTANQTYYFGVRMYGNGNGEFTMRLSRGVTYTGRPYHEATICLVPGQTATVPEFDDYDEDQGMTLPKAAAKDTKYHYNVLWMYSDNESVLSVSGSQMTARAAGSSTLMVKYTDRLYVYHVTVQDMGQIILPDGLVQLRSGAFAGDGRVQCVTVPEGAERIDRDAFKDSGLKQLIVEGMETQLSASALRGTENCIILCHDGSRAGYFAQNHGIDCFFID